MTQRIIVYTTSWCGDCAVLKNYLDDRGVAYEERDIEIDPEAHRIMMTYTNGKRVIPTVDVNGIILINPRLKQVANLIA